MRYIRTSQSDWLKVALDCYANKTPFVLVDDARLGFTSQDLETGIALISAANKRGLSFTEIALLLGSLGVCGMGIWLIVVAVVDPEPTSKFGFLLAGGVVLIVTGSLSILATLGLRWSIRVKWNDDGCSFEACPC